MILNDGTIVELENICDNPEQGFEVRGDVWLMYEDRMVASWHTHPGANNNLSTNDHAGFLNWPNLLHYIIGTDGLACYAVEGRKVIRVE